MKLSVYFTPLGLKSSAVAGKPVLVVDVLRTTTSVVTALVNGARAVLPAKTAEDALRLAQNLERDAVLLAGERGAQRIEGFALGNSPLEMTPETIAGKTLVMATTNGTPALVAAESGTPVLIGAVVNFAAVADRARRELQERGEFIILCAGREGMFALEDAYFAGRITQELIPSRERRRADLNDAAVASLQLVRRFGDKWPRAVAASAAARDLRRLGFRHDLTRATAMNLHDAVPVYAERLVTIPTPT